MNEILGSIKQRLSVAVVIKTVSSMGDSDG